MPNTLRLLLVPLDERPVNIRYPEMVARIAGAKLLLPPLELRGRKRKAADLSKVQEWLVRESNDAFAALISCDYLGYGNLINARISRDTALEVIDRLSVLTRLTIPVHAFSLITRVSNADDNGEEPNYWKDWGTKFYRYSHLKDRALSGDELSAEEVGELAGLEQILPSDFTIDWLTRRLRNNTVNLALVELTAKGVLCSLLLTSDDTAKWGFPSRERAWLKSWTTLIDGLSDKVQMHPGADEVGTALVSRLINENSGQSPKVFVDYAIDADKILIAPYEDRPIVETVIGQIRACGGSVIDDIDQADVILGVLTPSPDRKDYRPEYLESDRMTRTAPYEALFSRLASAQHRGWPIILADVAYPNGSDPLSIEILLNPESPLDIGALAAYGAWNTAGNTLGVAIAQGLCAQMTEAVPERILAQKTFLAHRFLEDWGYQAVIRREARNFARNLWNRQEPDPDKIDEVSSVAAFVEEHLSALLKKLQDRGVGKDLIINPGSTRLPWNRTFEVDFELVPSN